jgi:hypothetical protein
MRLQDQALLALSTLASQKGSAGGRLEDFADAVVGLGRAFEVFVGSNLLANFLALQQDIRLCVWPMRLLVTYLLWSDWLLRGLCKLFNSLGVMSQVVLAAHENDGKTLAEV